MGILFNQFIDVIEWVDNTTDTIIWKYPRQDNEIKYHAKLTVRESQQAIFLNEGRMADVFQPGLYTLDTENMPILTTLKSWKYGFNSPFKADVYFVSTKQFLDQKWGTKNPITINDDRFGLADIRAFGTYAFEVTDAAKFLKEIAGTESMYTTYQITDQLRSLVTSKVSNALAAGNFPIEKFVANLDAISSACQDKLNTDFADYGLKITRFILENVSMPDDLKKEIFELSRLSKINVQQLTAYKAAESITTAAGNPGMGGIGASIGVGMGLGRVVSNALNSSMNQSTSAPPPVPQAVQYFIAVNGQQNGPYTQEQLHQMIQSGSVTKETLAWKAGMASWSAANSISELSSLFDTVPPPLPPPPPAQ